MPWPEADFDSAHTLTRRGCPIFRVFCERWEPRTPEAPRLDVEVAFARVERTLLSVAFDLDFGFDSDFGLILNRVPSYRRRVHRGRAALQRRVRFTNRCRLQPPSESVTKRVPHPSRVLCERAGPLISSSPRSLMVEAHKTNHHTPAPEGRPMIAQDVSPGWVSKREPSPGGTTEDRRSGKSKRKTAPKSEQPGRARRSVVPMKAIDREQQDHSRSE
jgi:hypothetical protein